MKIGVQSAGLCVLMNRRCGIASTLAIMSSNGTIRASSQGLSSKAGAGASPWGHNSEATMPCIHVVPDFGGVVMKMSSGREVNRSHRWLSSWTCWRRRVAGSSGAIPRT